MALDGLSNQSVGIYRTKGSSEKTEKLAAHYKEKTENNLSNIEETGLIEKVDPDKKKEQDKNNDDATKELILSSANKLIEENENNETLSLTIEDENTSIEIEYTLKFNQETNLIEMKNEKTNELIETIQPKELMKVLSKAKSIEGILIDKEI